MTGSTLKTSLGKQLLVLLGFLALSALAAGLGSIFTINNVDGWYAQAEKVAWSPPNWLFSPTWTVLYTLIALAAWLVWRNTDERLKTARKNALIIYTVQIILNALWTPMFFGGYPVFGSAALRLAMAIIFLLAISIIVMILQYAKVSKIAAWLMVPYLLWILFASTLNAGVAVLNP